MTHWPFKLGFVLFALFMQTSTLAAKLIHISKQPLSALPKPLVTSQANRLQLNQEKSTFHVSDSHLDFNGTSHERLEQHYKNIKIWSSQVIRHKKNSSHQSMTSPALSFNGQYYENLATDLGDMPPKFLSAPPSSLKYLSNYDTRSITKLKLKPTIFIDDKLRAHWAYVVNFAVMPKHGRPQKPTLIIDAKSHYIYKQWDNIKTHHTPVKGLGYGGNESTGRHQYGVGLQALNMMRDDSLQECFLENETTKVIDMKHDFDDCWEDDDSCKDKVFDVFQFHCLDSQKIAPDFFWTGTQHDGLDPINGAYSPSNDALYTGNIIHDMYQDWYDTAVLTDKEHKPMQLVMRVHYDLAFDNAYWDGEQMTFGDGDDETYPLVSLDVAAHEISHGFTEQHSGLVYMAQSGGIDEAFSDMAAKAAEFYATGQVHWTLGESLSKDHTPIRYLDKPSKDGISIDRADEYYDGLDVHFSSGVYNRLFYLIANQPGWDTHKAFNVMVKANSDYWTPHATFESAACGILNAAMDYHYETEGILKQLDQVKINTSSC